MVSTATQLAGVTFDNVLMNGAGIRCLTVSDMDTIRQSAAGACVTKTATLQPRPGNPEPRYYETAIGSINSMGLPNEGFDYYLDYILRCQEDQGTPVVLSTIGITKEDTHTMLKRLQASPYTGLTELNLSCPNVPGKPQLGYDFEGTARLLQEIATYFDKPFGVKLPPFFDLVHFDQMADILNQTPVRFVNSINSVGNGLMIADETVVMKPKNSFGGLGGAMIKPIALANVHAFYQRLRSDIQIIGTGGVTTGRDVFEHILCGASVVQVGTTLLQEGVSVFDRLTQELTDIMVEKGYDTLDDFRGKLKYIPE